MVLTDGDPTTLAWYQMNKLNIFDCDDDSDDKDDDNDDNNDDDKEDDKDQRKEITGSMIFPSSLVASSTNWTNSSDF